MVEFLVARKSVPIACTFGMWSTTLNKKNLDSFRPIAVGETFRPLVSRICCLAVRPDLPDTFIPYGQLGVGIPSGIETAIHSF